MKKQGKPSRQRKNPKVERVENPSWLATTLIGVGAFVLGGVITISSIRKNPSQGIVYYYWASEKMVAGFTRYVPTLQNSATGEVFVLEPEITESGALWEAEREIESRGGIAQKGHPVLANPNRRRMSLRSARSRIR
jgi:hypothetical protein